MGDFFLVFAQTEGQSAERPAGHGIKILPARFPHLIGEGPPFGTIAGQDTISARVRQIHCNVEAGGRPGKAPVAACSIR